MQLHERIARARHALTEARIQARHAADDLENYATAFAAGLDCKALGANERAQTRALAAALLTDTDHNTIQHHHQLAQDAAERADADLDCLLDERREAEQRIWAQLADYLRGKMDHVHAPQQAAREVIRSEAVQSLHDQVVAEDAAREEMLQRAEAETRQYYAEDKPRDLEEASLQEWETTEEGALPVSPDDLPF